MTSCRGAASPPLASGSPPRAAATLSALAALRCCGPRAARADGDPASDVLLGENVFYPYAPPVSPALQKTLNAETAAAKAAGFPLKVALIAAPVDLGVIPDLFGKPQQYADVPRPGDQLPRQAAAARGDAGRRTASRG